MPLPAYPPPPTAPVDLTVPAANSQVVLACLSAVAVLGVGWALVEGYRTRSVTFLAVLVGGLATCLLEPFADLLGLVWFPVRDQVHAFTGLGIPIPLFVVVGYLCLFGLMTWVTVRVFERRPGRRAYWTFTLGTFLVACVFEWILLTSGAYLYYGRQPLEVLGYPLIWMTINSGACAVSALVIVRFRAFFTGARAFAVVLLIPCVDGMVMLGTGWPAFAGLHSDLPSWAVQVTGLVSTGIGLLLRAGIAEVCCRDGRWATEPSPELPRPRAAAPQEVGS